MSEHPQPNETRERQKDRERRARAWEFIFDCYERHKKETQAENSEDSEAKAK